MFEAHKNCRHYRNIVKSFHEKKKRLAFKSTKVMRKPGDVFGLAQMTPVVILVFACHNHCRSQFGQAAILVLESNSHCLTAFFNRLKNKLHHEVYFPDHQFTVLILADSKALVGLTLKGCLSFSSVHRKGKGFHNWTFSTVRSWGEEPQGVWSLSVQDSGKSFDTVT